MAKSVRRPQTQKPRGMKKSSQNGFAMTRTPKPYKRPKYGITAEAF